MCRSARNVHHHPGKDQARDAASAPLHDDLSQQYHHHPAEIQASGIEPHSPVHAEENESVTNPPVTPLATNADNLDIGLVIANSRNRVQEPSGKATAT